MMQKSTLNILLQNIEKILEQQIRTECKQLECNCIEFAILSSHQTSKQATISINFPIDKKEKRYLAKEFFDEFRTINQIIQKRTLNYMNESQTQVALLYGKDALFQNNSLLYT